MSVDLRSTSMFAKVSILLMDDCLIKLEHGRTEDRMRRVMYDTIQHVVIWRAIPWVRIVLCAVGFGLPGIALMFVGRNPGVAIGIVLLAIAVGLIARYFYCRVTTIRIVRDGKPQDITGLFSPRKVRKFRDRLVPAIQRVQGLTPAAAAGEVSRPVDPTSAPVG